MGKPGSDNRLYVNEGSGTLFELTPLRTTQSFWFLGVRIQFRKLLMQHLLRHRRTSRTGTFCEAQRLAKRVLDLHRGAREPYLQSGGEQQMVDAAIMEGEDRRCHSVPFQ
jgi:hypothetical protein